MGWRSARNLSHVPLLGLSRVLVIWVRPSSLSVSLGPSLAQRHSCVPRLYLDCSWVQEAAESRPYVGFVGAAMDSPSVPPNWERQPSVTLWHHSGAWACHHLLWHVMMRLLSPWWKGWQWVSLWLLGAASEGTHPPHKPAGAPQLEAP